MLSGCWYDRDSTRTSSCCEGTNHEPAGDMCNRKSRDVFHNDRSQETHLSSGGPSSRNWAKADGESHPEWPRLWRLGADVCQTCCWRSDRSGCSSFSVYITLKVKQKVWPVVPFCSAGITLERGRRFHADSGSVQQPPGSTCGKPESKGLSKRNENCMDLGTSHTLSHMQWGFKEKPKPPPGTSRNWE